jgi:WD40 repeat protein
VSGASPYVGLAPFGEQDADRFFGRDAERKRIISNLQASRLTLLYARSGVGKTSLLRAGVVARLAAAPGSRLVPFIFSSWSGDPNVELPRALGAGGDGLEEALERSTARMDATLLVILDQFEEFFEYHTGKPEGTRFGDELASCVQRNDLRVHFLVSIREDAYSRLGDEFKGRLPNVYSNYLHLDDLDERGARAAIEEPLRHGNGSASIEPALVDQVLRDVRRDEASNGHSRYETAHLQYVLRRLWDEEAKRGSPVLRAATLEELGGSKAIFERHFDEAVTGLGSAEQDALAKAFRFLVTSGGTKRAESVADLADLTGAERPTLERALGHLREARVLTPVTVGGQTRYELAHDLLAGAALEWRRERERAREMRALKRTAAGLGLLAVLLGGLIVWALLENAAAERQADRARAQALVARSVNQLSIDPERSVALAREAWQLSNTPEAEDALRRALTASLVRDRLDVGTTWGGSISRNGEVVVSEGPEGTQVWRGLQAGAPAVRLPRNEAVSSPISAPGIALSADGSVVAVTTRDGVQVARTDGGAGRVRIAGASAPAVSADGRFVAVIDRRGNIRAVDARTGRSLARSPAIDPEVDALGRAVWPTVLAFDPSDDGRLIAGDCVGGELGVWNWRDGRSRTLRAQVRGVPTGTLRGGATACLLAVSPDGTRAVQSHLGGSVSLWDLARGRRAGSDLTGKDAIRDVAWSPDGERFAVAAGKVATIHDASGREVSSTPSQVDFLSSVAFDDPNGELFVTSSRDGVARVWDVRTAGLRAELRGHTDEIADAAFAARGRDVVTLSLDGTSRSWRVFQGRVIPHGDWVLDAAFSPDGERVATAAADGKARVTSLGGGRRVPIESDVDLQTANSIAFDPGGRRVAVAGGGAQYGQIVVADASTGTALKEMFPPGEAVRSVAFSPNGTWLVATAVGAKPSLWRLADFAGIALGVPPTATLDVPSGRSAVWAEFSPDGRSIVTAASDGVARIFDARTRRKTRELKAPGVMFGATFSPDGRRMLTYGSDFIGRIWGVRTRQRLAVLRGHTSWISGGAFSRDGRTVVTGSADQTTRVWDSHTGRLLSTQRMHGDAVNSVAYGRRGRVILSAGDDRTARLYRCATCDPIEGLVRMASDRIVSRGS